MQIKILDSIDNISPAEWDSLLNSEPNHSLDCTTNTNNVNSSASPFLQHEFLAAIERHQCVGQRHGWIPRHIVIYDQEIAVAASPLYIKTNSYGEFVFDWAWADAYQRSGLMYYPKLVSSIPYTPATGQRLLVKSDQNQIRLRQLLIEATIQLAQQENMSSIHWLFPNSNDRLALDSGDLLQRIDTQFHWRNNQYHSFDDFLQTLTSSRRKKIKRERKRALEQEVTIRCVEGSQATEDDISLADFFYRTTFDKKSGYASFNANFFRDIAHNIQDCLVIFFAEHNNETIAASICYRSGSALYGRHWGCSKEMHSLHFELCYYQGIDYCINNNLQLFEPGAQGEHKISRGFLPVPVYSAHWINHPEFKTAIAQYLANEIPVIRDYIVELETHSPYKETPVWYKPIAQEIAMLVHDS
ncbi:FIG110192: hypothetical protein [hydrothermal vent metagenome]|uniref:COGs COG3146 n=1 Tax=hydrothermal vent metagenome TaxID=652676 RepID=A0A3B0XRP0_9ZZZZ